MHKRFFLRLIFGVFLSCSFHACVNLTAINDYSSSAVKSLKKFEDIEYSFTKACKQKCRVEQLENQQLAKVSCVCSNERSADSAIMAVYQAIKGYFDGMTKLSANGVTNYKLNSLSKALKESDFGEIIIDKSTVDAYAKIGNILSRSVTDAYRKKKLAAYIGEANEAIKLLLDKFEFILVSNLSKRTETQKERLKSYYFDLMNDANASTYEKKKLIEEYDSDIEFLDLIQKQFKSYGRSLGTLAKAHQQLYNNRNKLQAKEVRILFVQFYSDIEDIMGEWNKLKNEN